MEVREVGGRGGWGRRGGTRSVDAMVQCAQPYTSGMTWRHTLFEGAIPSLTLDAKPFATLWPSKGPVLSVSHFFDISLVLLPLSLSGNDDRCTNGLEISSIGHYCLHQKNCYTARSLMDDSSENGFLGEMISKCIFSSENVLCCCCFCALTHDD